MSFTKCRTDEGRVAITCDKCGTTPETTQPRFEDLLDAWARAHTCDRPATQARP